MKLILTKKILREKITKEMVKFICTISRFATQTSCGGLVCPVLMLYPLIETLFGFVVS